MSAREERECEEAGKQQEKIKWSKDSRKHSKTKFIETFAAGKLTSKLNNFRLIKLTLTKKRKTDEKTLVWHEKSAGEIKERACSKKMDLVKDKLKRSSYYKINQSQSHRNYQLKPISVQPALDQ